MQQQQVMIDDDLSSMSNAMNHEIIYGGPFFRSDPLFTFMNMERTRLSRYDSFWLGSIGKAATDIFYRSDRRTPQPSPNNASVFAFTLSLNKRMVTYTHYSVIDVLQNVSALLIAVYSLVTTLSANFAAFNFKLTAITNMYSVSFRRDSKDNYGRVTLTTAQYLRLICAVALPTKLCCHSSK